MDAATDRIQQLQEDYDRKKEGEEGISLLALKNQTFVSYLHNLTLLILHRLENGSLQGCQDAVKTLVRLRVTMERGIKPLEGKLSYQIQKLIKAHEGTVDESLSYKPRPEAMEPSQAEVLEDAEERTADEPQRKYVPPRIAAVQPTKRRRNVAVEAFLDQVSTAPAAEPSVGSTIAKQGRVDRTMRDMASDQQKQKFEEDNFMRLPKPSKKQRRTQQREAFGGESWGFGGNFDGMTVASSSLVERSREPLQSPKPTEGRFERRRKTMEKKQRGRR